jgi:hypothetical protein
MIEMVYVGDVFGKNVLHQRVLSMMTGVSSLISIAEVDGRVGTVAERLVA